MNSSISFVVLLGDSIFDNAVYVPSEPAVIDQLNTSLPDSWEGILLAKDGTVSHDVLQQLKRLPEYFNHLVISCGGNDALQCLHLLNEPVGSVRDALVMLQLYIQQQFRSKYRQVLVEALNTGRPVTVCTIYNHIPDLGIAEQAALALFNEVILEEAARHAISVIDLRVICREISDYSEVSTIEPSAKGGQKIVDAILGQLQLTPQVNTEDAMAESIVKTPFQATIQIHFVSKLSQTDAVEEQTLLVQFVAQDRLLLKESSMLLDEFHLNFGDEIIVERCGNGKESFRLISIVTPSKMRHFTCTSYGSLQGLTDFIHQIGGEWEQELIYTFFHVPEGMIEEFNQRTGLDLLSMTETGSGDQPWQDAA